MTEPARMSRRAVLLGGGVAAMGALGAGAAAVVSGALPGRSRLTQLFGSDGGVATPLPSIAPGHSVQGEFTSRQRLGRRCGYQIAYPGPAAERLPVVIVLHGKGADHRYAFGQQLGLDRYLVAGRHRFALASVDGGDTYWHRRASGEDAGAMVGSEFLPLLAGRGLDISRIGLLGWSMGGFGALWLSGQLGANRVAGAAVASPAIWSTAGATAPGAFDDAEDFAAHDVFTHREWVETLALRVDCGVSDGFCPAARTYAASLRPPPTSSFTPGAHTLGYWRGRAPAQLAFLAAAFG
jgi:pimeloyl-ACP methyl ester carboxylesterase